MACQDEMGQGWAYQEEGGISGIGACQIPNPFLGLIHQQGSTPTCVNDMVQLQIDLLPLLGHMSTYPEETSSGQHLLHSFGLVPASLCRDFNWIGLFEGPCV